MQVNKLFELSRYNRTLIAGKRCGCYYCLETFDSTDVVEYTNNDKTAICPKCGIDAVIPSTDVVLLSKAHDFWFKTFNVASDLDEWSDIAATDPEIIND